MLDIAEFSIILPPDGTPPKAIIVIVPSSNDDGREWITYQQPRLSKEWRRLALKHNCAIVGCYFTDKEPSFIEDYCDMRSGSGDKLINFLADHGLIDVPILIWGFSAGGQFAYEFAAHYPHRVAGFVVNKGGIYYTALCDEAARDIPALLIYGTFDSVYRVSIIKGLFELNRAAGASWALIPEPAGHSLGSSVLFGVEFFDKILSTI